MPTQSTITPPAGYHIVQLAPPFGEKAPDGLMCFFAPGVIQKWLPWQTYYKWPPTAKGLLGFLFALPIPEPAPWRDVEAGETIAEGDEVQSVSTGIWLRSIFVDSVGARGLRYRTQRPPVDGTISKGGDEPCPETTPTNTESSKSFRAETSGSNAPSDGPIPSGAQPFWKCKCGKLSGLTTTVCPKCGLNLANPSDDPTPSGAQDTLRVDRDWQPSDEAYAAAKTLTDYFAKEGMETWRFMGVCARTALEQVEQSNTALRDSLQRAEAERDKAMDDVSHANGCTAAALAQRDEYHTKYAQVVALHAKESEHRAQAQADCAEAQARYGNWIISRDDSRPDGHQWDYRHKNYDGPEDGRCGTAGSLDQVRDYCDEMEEAECSDMRAELETLRAEKAHDAQTEWVDARFVEKANADLSALRAAADGLRDALAHPDIHWGSQTAILTRQSALAAYSTKLTTKTNQ